MPYCLWDQCTPDQCRGKLVLGVHHEIENKKRVWKGTSDVKQLDVWLEGSRFW